MTPPPAGGRPKATTTRRVSHCTTHPTYTAGCPHCRAHAAAYNRAWRRDTAYGRPRQVPSTGTVRRLRGLAAANWSAADLAARLGCTAANINRITGPRTPELVADTTATAVQRLARALRGRDGGSRIAGQRAHTKGWVPLTRWGDDIDDPDATPEAGWDPPARTNRGADLIDDIAWLTDAGATWPDLEARLHATREALVTALRRHHRPDLRARIDTHTYGAPQATPETRRAVA